MDTDTSETVGFADGFEGGFTGWSRASDVPQDPNNLKNPVAWMITRSTERAVAGSASLRYYLDGRQDDGTIWIVRGISAVWETEMTYFVDDVKLTAIPR